MSKSINDYRPSGRSNMPKYIKDAWVKELRGNKRQINRLLRGKRVDGRIGYCCLGVLCDMGSDKWEKKESFGDVRYSYDGHHQMPPGYVSEAAGLDVDDQNTLANMNDNGIGFKRIANWIEKNL